MAESSEAPYTNTPEYRIGKALRDCRGFLAMASNTDTPKTGTWSAEHFLQGACDQIRHAAKMLEELDPNRPYTERSIIAIDKAQKACSAIYSCEISQPKPDYRKAASEILERQETVLDQLGRELQTIARHARRTTVVPQPKTYASKMKARPLEANDSTMQFLRGMRGTSYWERLKKFFPMETQALEASTTPAPLPAAAPPEAPATAPEKAQRKRGRPFEGRKCEELRIRVTGDGLRVKHEEEISKSGSGKLVAWGDFGVPTDWEHVLLQVFADIVKSGSTLKKIPKSTLSNYNKRFKDNTGVSDRLLIRDGKTLRSDAQFLR